MEEKKENITEYPFAEEVGPAIESVDQDELWQSKLCNSLLGEHLYKLMVSQTDYMQRKDNNHLPQSPLKR